MPFIDPTQEQAEGVIVTAANVGAGEEMVVFINLHTKEGRAPHDCQEEVFFHLFITLPCICYLSRVSPVVHYKAMSKAMLTAFSTSSSSATLPVTMNCVRKDVGVS